MLADIACPPGDTADGTLIAHLFTTLPTKAEYQITIEGSDMPAARVTELEFWSLKPGFAAWAQDHDALEVGRCLQANTRNPYTLRARVGPDVAIYENCAARPLATLVGEVRPATDDLAAAALMNACPDPARAVCHVVAPGGESSDWHLTGPVRFTPGTAALESYRADDFTVRTDTPGEGFLVLTVTNCRGWSATIDGRGTAIHRVDGPLMGVRVPAGNHVVHLRFRPVLVWTGTALALSALGGAWLGCLALRLWRRRSLPAATGPPLPAAAAADPAPGSLPAH
jgi:hypothetical protein